MMGRPIVQLPDRRDALKTLGLATAVLALTKLIPSASAEENLPAMITRKIPSTGEVLPIIGLGTWQTFDVGASLTERLPLVEVLGAFAGLGGKLVDSSPMYGRSEEVAGDLIDSLKLRKKLFIATKVWTSGKKEGLAQMEASLGKLKADPIDLMQVHNLVDVDTHLATLREWKQAGRVRYVGVTHYNAGAHEELAKLIATVPLDFIQINYSVREREAERRLLPLARDRGVAVIINRPFAEGNLLSKLHDRPVPAWAAEIGCASWAQLLLKFIISNPAVTCVIPATSKLTHLRDNMKAAYGPLPDETLRARIAAEAA
jgi:diketogulonate reductase-like aldo/keto reductase